ncbi:MAG: DUF4129 domain-containing protein [Haloarculaceae archaeon]
MREVTRSAALGALALLAIAVAAATLDSTTATGPSAPSSVGRGTGTGSGGSGTGGVLLPAAPTGAPGEAIRLPPVLGLLLFLLLLAATVVLVGYATTDWRRTAQLVAAGVALLVLLFALSQLLPDAPGLFAPPLVPGGGGSGSDPTPTTPPPVAVLLVVGLAVVAVTAAIVRGGGRADSDSDPDEGTATEARDASDDRAAAVGRAAGRAADRIEGAAEVDNEVYRAWRELTRLVEAPDPATSTPGEFADAAVAAGLGREDVGELTRLFEEVRYGEIPPTDEYERRAVAVLRRIEARYAEDDA